MKNKTVAMLSPLCLALFAGSAWADLEPFSFGATETVTHDNNVSRTDDAHRVSDWFTKTEVRGAIDEPVGRDRILGSAAVNYSDYHKKIDDSLDAFGYRGALQLDWSTIGDLSGSLGADASRRRYDYGFEDVSGNDLNRSNQETDSHAFAKLQLGGPSRWKIFGGFDANRRRFSSTTYQVNDEQQWSQSVGTTYSTSPDLSFGITGNYVRGEYPNYGAPSDFNSKTVSGTTRWQASGNSSLSAVLGYTQQNSDLQSELRFVSGSLHWNWAPPSHFMVDFGLSRSSDGGATSPTTAALNDRSLNTTGSLNVTYELTAKVSLVASGQYALRKYENVKVPVVLLDGTVDPSRFYLVSGSNRTSRFSLAAHYQPTRTTDLNCSATREVRSSGSVAIVTISPNYTDTSLQCAASISFK